MRRVLILSCHPLFAEGLEKLLAREPEMKVVGCEQDVSRAAELLEQLGPNVIIVDCTASQGTPPPALVQLLRDRPGVRLISLDLNDNHLSLYHAERRLVKQIGDLVEAAVGPESGLDAEASARGSLGSSAWWLPVPVLPHTRSSDSLSLVMGGIGGWEEVNDLTEVMELLRNRHATYALLSRMYREEVSASLLHELVKRVDEPPAGGQNAVDDEGYRLFESALRAMDRSDLEAVSQSLATEYAGLFLGLKENYVLPHESVYTDEERLMMQEARDEVVSEYRREELAMTEGLR